MDVSKVNSGRVQETRTSGNKEVGKAQTSSVKDKNQLGLEALAETKNNAGEEKVEFSPEAQMAREAFTIAKNTPDIRHEKVAKLKEAIRNGTYAPDPKAVADKMIQSSIEESLLTSTTST